MQSVNPVTSNQHLSNHVLLSHQPPTINHATVIPVTSNHAVISHQSCNQLIESLAIISHQESCCNQPSSTDHQSCNKLIQSQAIKDQQIMLLSAINHRPSVIQSIKQSRHQQPPLLQTAEGKRVCDLSLTLRLHHSQSSCQERAVSSSYIWCSEVYPPNAQFGRML